MSLIIGIKPYNAIFAHRQFLVSFDVLEPVAGNSIQFWEKNGLKYLYALFK